MNDMGKVVNTFVVVLPPNPMDDSANQSTTVLIGRAVLLGIFVVLAGTMPRNLFFALNLRFFASVPWAVPVTGLYLWFFWQRLKSNDERRRILRANPLPLRVWLWALVSGLLGIAVLIVALHFADRFVALPEQHLPSIAGLPKSTVLTLLLAAAPIAGIVEESASRGYMQGPIERRCGLMVAILITGTMFAVVHLDFTVILWPYYLAVTALYGFVTSRTNSILPAIVLHTIGNVYSNLDLWLHGRAEWQHAAGTAAHAWSHGAPTELVWLFGGILAMCFAFYKLSRSVHSPAAADIESAYSKRQE